MTRTDQLWFPNLGDPHAYLVSKALTALHYQEALSTALLVSVHVLGCFRKKEKNFNY